MMWRPQHRPDPKRLLDLTLGSALLVLAAPLLTAAVLVLALSRPADGVFLRDYRTGLNGRPFILSSLRTRRFRLDLLSRLPHVVRGDLSLVGPAPLKVGSAAGAAPWRQLVRPGLTGLAQVRRHSTLPWDETPLLDQHYVEHHWIGLDLAILAHTLPALYKARVRRDPHRLPRGHSRADTYWLGTVRRPDPGLPHARRPAAVPAKGAARAR
ncbi:sugar transferase [Streptomyces sp. GMY02]|uniref:sugar transferase n=1 Tax=Streptomyces sp. GMY02 TaxID=1333528 RepID=UPI001C2BB55F|nr:sugar transferase [Streptomyces sp. GMY02]QXE39179.1 sugar transferase [Streptomyces sp. GMY02]